jgi:hypothetical protein
MGFKNLGNTSNTAFMQAFGITEDAADVPFYISAENIFLYPNPTSSTLNIKFGRTSSAEIVICNLLGEPLIRTENKIIDVSNLAKGIFIIKCGAVVKKFIKE